MKKGIFFSVVTILGILLSSNNFPVGGKPTIIELIEKASVVNVYITSSDLKVVPPTVANLYPEGCAGINIPVEKLGDAYNEVQQTVVAELTKVFGSDKFKAADINQVETKTVSVLGQTGKVQKWETVGEPIMVVVDVSASYSFFPSDGKVDITYKVMGATRFIDPTLGILYMNPMGALFFAEKSFKNGDCPNSMDFYKEQVEPNSLLEELKNAVAGSLDKTYAKEKKQYDKAKK